MRRPLARSLLGSVAVLVALTATSFTPAQAQSDPTTTTTAPAGTTGAPETPSGDPAIDDLVGCVQGSRRLQVLFLIDESASLKDTDPDDRRVDAARGAIDSLIALASSEGSASPQVDVALAAFSNEYRLVQDWTEAGPDTAESLNDSLAKFADFNSGIDTDFVNALSAGREALADQAAEVTASGGQAPCRAVMLFTDGGYDLAVRANEADQERLGTTKPYAPGIELTSKEDVLEAEALGRKELCKPGGLADQLRNDDVTLLTVALSGSVARRSQIPLAAATTGKADDYPCGTQPKDGETARVQGAYLPAEDIDVLVTQFNGVGTRLAGGNLVPGPSKVKVCGKEPCDQGSRTFTLDKSLRRAQILALPPKAGASVVLETPDGETTTISEAGTSKVGATSSTTRSVADRGFVIDLERPDDVASWNGEWKVSIIDETEEQEGDAATLQIYVFSDIGVEFSELPVVRARRIDGHSGPPEAPGGRQGGRRRQGDRSPGPPARPGDRIRRDRRPRGQAGRSVHRHGRHPDGRHHQRDGRHRRGPHRDPQRGHPRVAVGAIGGPRPPARGVDPVRARLAEDALAHR
ncbi:VWA domain-containing protein [Aquihabitans daechungensis]|uniref:VWA domain-containing protein n=1 Tax=Aquihabitans daechungensis TaxID=1052257 RepID=UPI003BA1776D